jgi:hypothetical protein
MKKILLALFVFGTFLTASAQTTKTTTTTTTTHKYYYYPESNVYYDQASNSYWYYDEPTTQWTTVQTLPSTITVSKTRYPITYKGDDPWKNNAADMKKYKVKHNGNVKMKPKQ